MNRDRDRDRVLEFVKLVSIGLTLYGLVRIGESVASWWGR